jgi:hypothetical protein
MNDLMAVHTIYTDGGSVQAGTGIYIHREADEKLLALCREGVFAYILAARQMGKSSLMMRAAQRLAEKRVRSVTIDLTLIGGADQVTEEQWYFGLLTVLHKRLKLKVDLPLWWHERQRLTKAQRLIEFLEEIVLSEIKEPVVIFVDEIDTTLRLPFTDDFYAAIRYLYNERARIPTLKRLSFVLIGVATPSDLIRNTEQTPFNIGERVELSDFTFEEAMPLAAGLNLPPEESNQVLRWVLDWTGGHPYLTQRVCLLILKQQKNAWTREGVEQLVASQFLGGSGNEDHNLQFVRDMLLERVREPIDKVDLLLTYRLIIRANPPISDDEKSLIKSHLKLSGIVRREGNVLVVRNEIYKRFFDNVWVKNHLPPTWAKRQLKRARRIQVALATLLVMVLILALVSTSFALMAKRQTELANQQRKEADQQRLFAEAQRADADQQRQRAEELQKIAEERREEAEQQRQQTLDAVKDREAAIQQRVSVEAAAATRERINAANRALSDEAASYILNDERVGEDFEIRAASIAALGGRPGTVIVMNPKTGQVYTIVNQDWGLRRGFKPCSTISLITGLAGLTEKVIDPITTSSVGRRTAKLDLTDALAYSDKTYFEAVGGRVGFERMLEYARKLGLGQQTGVNYPNEYPGRLPIYKEGYAVNRMSAIGDNFEVTTIQLAVLISTIANGGKLLVPHWPRTPEENYNFKTEVRRDVDIPVENLMRIIPGMIGTVNYGEGRRAYYDNMTVAGVHGTCIGQEGWLGLFVSYAPVHDPKLTIVVITRGDSARDNYAAAVAGRIYSALAHRVQQR